MDNLSTIVHQSKERFHTEHYGAHSGSRAGLSDYNDGGFDHYNYSEDEEQEEFDGRIALGNDNEAADSSANDKYHSGL